MSEKKNRRQFLVTLDMPDGVSVEEMRTYIEEAIGAWKGSFDPESALFNLNGDSVKAKSVPKRTVVK